ncbi:MAG: nucleotidyltransferase family protein [Planctomycetaceae bacterium]
MRRFLAIIPAAGHSRRMGRPKLLLPLGGQTVIARVLAALDREPVTERVVIVRQDDEPLQEEVRAAGAMLVVPETPPPDMRTSVEHGLNAVRDRFSPDADDVWMLVPADHPVLEPMVVDALVSEWQRRRADVLVPTYRGRRGHPTLFRWSLADAVAGIPPGEGLNRLTRGGRFDVAELPIDDPAILTDLDTPEDYETLRRRWGDL